MTIQKKALSIGLLCLFNFSVFSIISLNSRFKIDLFNKKKIIKKLSSNMLPNNIINKKKSYNLYLDFESTQII